jgi:hypothetical protein
MRASPILIATSLLVAAACGDRDLPFSPDVPASSPAPATSGTGDLAVMTRNLYVGADDRATKPLLVACKRWLGSGRRRW